MVPLLILIVLLLIFGVGGLIKGVLWLALICLALFLISAIWGWMKYGATSARRQ